MKRKKTISLLTPMLFVLCMVVGWLVGAGMGKQQERDLAIKSGVGKWVILKTQKGEERKFFKYEK